MDQLVHRKCQLSKNNFLYTLILFIVFSSTSKRNHNFTNNYNSAREHKGSFYQSNNNYKRERFNSDGNNPITSKYNSQYLNKPKFEELEIDITNIKYSLNLKFKYPLHEMLAHFEHLNSKKLFDSKPTFKIPVAEICNEMKKEVVTFKLKGRERSTTAYNAFDNKNKFDTPASFSNLEKRHSTSVNEYTNSGMKIPVNNPLANIGKSFNKYDDPNLLLNHVTINFNGLNANLNN